MTETTKTENTKKAKFETVADLKKAIENDFVPQIMVDRCSAFHGNDIARFQAWLMEKSYQGKMNAETYNKVLAETHNVLQAVTSAWIYKKRELSTETKKARFEKEMEKLKAKYGITD